MPPTRGCASRSSKDPAQIEDINDLYLFARVVDAGGFAAAERDTGIPKSRLSRRIAGLEKQLGVRLIHRSAHAFSVTDTGQGVYRHARAIADEAQAAGRGKKLFGNGAQPIGLKLVESKASTTGVIISTYVRAGEVTTGSFAREQPSPAELERRARVAAEG